MKKRHKPIPMSQEEQMLCIAVVSKIIRRMENKADRVGYNIDADEHWIVVHNIITDYDMGKPLSKGLALTIYELLEQVSNRIGYDFWGGFVYYLERVEV